MTGTQLEMQERVVLDRAPMASIERMGADEIDRAGDETSGPSGHDQENAIGHRLADERIELPGQIRPAPFARAGLHVEGEEGVPYGFGQIGTREPNHVDAGWERVAPPAADDLALACRERGQEVVERAIGRIEPVVLLIIALQEAVPAEQAPFRLRGEGDVSRGGIPQPAQLDEPCGEPLRNRVCLGAGTSKQAPARHRSERHRDREFGIILTAGALIGVGPSVIEQVFAAAEPEASSAWRKACEMNGLYSHPSEFEFASTERGSADPDGAHSSAGSIRAAGTLQPLGL